MSIYALVRRFACAMALLCAGDAWSEGNTVAAPQINPEFIRWQRRQNAPKNQANSSAATNAQTRTTRLLTSPSGTGKAELISLPEGLTPTMIDFSYLNSLNSVNVGSVSGSIPPSHDPRDLTPVRHQDPQDTGIGTCWAQASVGSMETWLLLNGYGQNQFSVRNVVNREGWDGNSWYGGNFIRSAAYLLRWDGPVWENDDPYTNRNGVVNYSFDSPAVPPAYHVQQTRLVPARTGALDNNSLKKAILEYGGLYATMKLYTPYYTGTSELIPYWNNNGAYYCPEKGAGHAVTLVGWDDNYPKENFNANCRPAGNGAWIVKDSYGVEPPRDNGYIYVSYYDTTFAYTESCAFPLIESSDNYGMVYQYDEFGQIMEWGIPANSKQIYTSGYCANMFTADKSGGLAAVGFYATIPRATYKIRIYTGCSASKPSSGTLALEQSGTVNDYAGYYTIPLKNAVEIARGQRFSVVVMLSTPGAAPFSLEIAVDGYTSNASANAGESFFSMDGSDWYDFTQNANLTYGVPANFCCKAYMKSATAAKPTLTAIAISGVSSLTSGASAQFICEATYSDGSKKAVSPTWSIDRNSQSYATVSASGLVTAKNVSCQRTVTVKASYTEDGVTKSDTWDLYVTVAAPSAPTGVSATQGTEASCVRVNWTAPNGATEYAVYRATADNSRNAQYLENVTVAKYNDASATPGVDYWYFVKAKNSSGASGFSAGANGWRKLAPPESVVASDTLLDKVALEWSEVEGATHYRVYRAESIDGEKTALGDWQTTTTFDDTTATADATYYYYIVAAVDANGNRPSDCSIAEDGTRAEPVAIDHLEIRGDAKIAAGGFADYAADAIYTDGHRVANIVPDGWEIVGDGASVVNGRVTAASIAENKEIALIATCTEDGKTVTGSKGITIAAVKPVAPRNVAATATAQGVTLSWNAVAGAASYVVYREGIVTGHVVPGAPESVVPATTYTDATALPGVTYTYTVSAANGAGEGPQSSPAVMATVPLAAPAGLTATNDRTDGVLVSWQPVTGATHYRVARAANGDGTKTELGSWTVETSFLDTTASVDSSLYYFVRAATDSAGANAGDWSASVVGRIIPTAPTLLSLSISGPDRVAASGSAVYSCTAAYDDGTTVAVAPIWSVMPSNTATIGSNGNLTALAVSSDISIVITAEFEGIAATKSVKIVAPPPPEAEQTATISNVRVKPRWPFSALVDIDFTLTTKPTGTRAIISLSGQDGDHNAPLAATTVTGDAVGAAVAAGEHRLTWNVGADYPGFHAASFDVKIEAIPYIIAAPANVTASQGTSTRGVNLSWDAVEDATGYEIWRARGSMDTADAILVTNMEAAVAYEDTSVNPGDIYFYWFKTVTQYGTGDFSASVFGYRARIAGTVAFDANGGTASASSLNYTAGNPYGTLPTASRTGYTFAGWFTSATGGSEVTAATPADENIATLYARWTPHTYTIHFDANSGTGTMADLPMTYDMATNLTANAFSNNGWVFTGWATSANGEVAYADRARVTNLSTSNGATVALFAVWGLAAPANIRHSTSSYCEESLSSTGVVKVVWHVRHSLSWDAAEGAASYKVFRNTANDLPSATLLATVTGTSYGFDGTGKEPAYYYWVVAVKGASSAASDAFTVAESMVDLMPLRNLLTTMESINPDGLLEDNEINTAINNPRYSDMDGNKTVNSPEELYVFTRIKALNADKQLISDVMRGDYTNIGGSTLLELFELSECCRGMWGGNYSSVVLFPKRPSNVSATQQNYSTAKVVVSWTGVADAQSYEVWRSATKDFSSGVAKVADVTTTSYTDTSVSYRSPYSYMILAKYADGSSLFYPIYVYGYWGNWCWAAIDKEVDLRPLKSLLNLLDFSAGGNRDGYLDDNELEMAMANPHRADLDGNSAAFSTEEKSVFTRIQALNTDKELLSHIMKGDYTYRNMTLAQFRELQSISDAIKELTKNKSN